MFELVPFEPRFANAILAWPRDGRELEHWAALAERPDASIFRTWHADADVSAHVLLDGATPVAYGEMWREPHEDTVELARILVAPAHRRRGLGRRLVESLIERATFPTIWLRVVPTNAAALACYESAGFVRAPAAVQERFNARQPRRYVWLSRPRFC